MVTDPVSGSRLTFGGLATGIDTAAIVDALLRVERQPIARLESQRSSVRTQQDLLRQFNGLLLALREAARAIDNRSDTLATASPAEELLVLTAASSDPDALVASASGRAAPGVYEVRVEQLASTARRVSAAFAAPTDVVGGAGDTFRVDFGGDVPLELLLDADLTLEGLVDRINADPTGRGEVRASLLDDGMGNVRMVLAGTRTGALRNVTVTTSLVGPGGAPFVDATLSRDATNARLVVLGVPIERPGNEISDALPGISLSLREANDPLDPTDVETVTVSRDDGAIAERLQAFVDAYNAVRQFVQKQSTVGTGQQRAGPLSGDFTLRTVERTLQGVLQGTRSFAGNAFTSLGAIGIAFDRDGRLALDRAKLDAVLDRDPDSVRELLSGDGTTDGIATALARSLESLVRAGDGAVPGRIASLDRRAAQIGRAIERMEQRIGEREEELVRQFAALERLVSTLQASAGFLQRSASGNGG